MPSYIDLEAKDRLKLRKVLSSKPTEWSDEELTFAMAFVADEFAHIVRALIKDSQGKTDKEIENEAIGPKDVFTAILLSMFLDVLTEARRRGDNLTDVTLHLMNHMGSNWQKFFTSVIDAHEATLVASGIGKNARKN